VPAEGDQFPLPAVTAVQPQQAVRKDAALEEGTGLILHDLQQVGCLPVISGAGTVK
jgi:hypothetical protein